MLCYAILCYAILYYTMLCYAILYYTVLYYVTLYYTILIIYYTILYYTILYYTLLILYYTVLCYAMLRYTILYYTILYYTTAALGSISAGIAGWQFPRLVSYSAFKHCKPFSDSPSFVPATPRRQWLVCSRLLYYTTLLMHWALFLLGLPDGSSHV